MGDSWRAMQSRGLLDEVEFAIFEYVDWFNTMNQLVIAVDEDAAGNLYVGSSSGFDAGQRAALKAHGVQRVPRSGALHAEEELLRAVDDLQRLGTSVRYPCGPSEHNCLEQLIIRGMIIE